MISLTVHKRWPGYEAHVTGNKQVWEGGLSEVEALGKLVMALDADARAKKGISAGLAWLARVIFGRAGIRVERE